MTKKGTNKKYIEQCFDVLSKRWNFLDEIRISLANSFDKYLLSFATGSLYLSILFTDKANGDNPLSHKFLLGIGWGVLVASIIFSLLSIYLGIFAYKRQMAITKENIDAINEDKNYCEPINVWNIALSIFQIVGIFLFVVGIITLSIFYYLNL